MNTRSDQGKKWQIQNRYQSLYICVCHQLSIFHTVITVHFCVFRSHFICGFWENLIAAQAGCKLTTAEDDFELLLILCFHLASGGLQGCALCLVLCGRRHARQAQYRLNHIPRPIRGTSANLSKSTTQWKTQHCAGLLVYLVWDPQLNVQHQWKRS